MQNIDLQAISNQELSFQFEDETYVLVLRTTQSTTSLTISRSDIVVVNNVRMIPFSPTIQYDYLKTTGDFILQTSNQELVDYTKFGTSQFLVYANLQDLEDLQSLQDLSQ